MRFAAKLALRSAVVGVAVAAVIIPATVASAAGVLSVSKTTGLTNGEVVSVSATGLAASTGYSIVECSGLTGEAACDTKPADEVTGLTDGSGDTGEHMFTVREGAIGNGACPVAPDGSGCYLIAATSTTDVALQAISFVPLPSITIKPNKNVKAGATVTVKGKRFPVPSGSEVAVAECTKSDNAKTCDTAAPVLGPTTNGKFTIKFPILTGKQGKLNFKPGSTVYLAATTDLAGMGADKSQDAVGSVGLASLATKTSAKFSKTSDKVSGTVKAGGTGVSGLKATLDIKAGKKWKKVASLKTHKGGAFSSKKVKKSGKYEVLTPSQKGYSASHSKTIKVKV